MISEKEVMIDSILALFKQRLMDKDFELDIRYIVCGVMGLTYVDSSNKAQNSFGIISDCEDFQSLLASHMLCSYMDACSKDALVSNEGALQWAGFRRNKF